jgi:hypothetical protein
MRIKARYFRLALTALTLLVLLFSVSGATPVRGQMAFLFVDDDNCPGPGAGTLFDPFCKIQDAIDAASPGALISVSGGRYTEYLDIPAEYLTMIVSDLADEIESFEVPAGSEEPEVLPNTTWKVNTKERVSACDNRPGLKKIYVTVLDDKNVPLPGVKVRFDTEPSEGIAYDHPNVWGLTNEQGVVEWDHLGVPTRYRLWMGDEEDPLVTNIRTDLGNEYCYINGRATSWRPVNRPGIYSYRIEIQRKGVGE